MKKDRIRELLNFDNHHILVIGDVMLDQYILGKVNRISPEAPVPVLDLNERSFKLGGAANVALNVKSLGAEVSLIGVIGNDRHGSLLKSQLEKASIADTLVIDDNRKTTCKTRIIAQNQHLLRIDEESLDEIDQDLADHILANAEEIHRAKKVDLIIFQDYNKGCLSPYLITEVIKWAKKNNVKTALDPKVNNIDYYKGVDFFKPNLKEIRNILKREFQITLKDLNEAAENIRKILNSTTILVTLSAQGIFIYSDKKGQIIPTYTKEIVDVSGAGDSVLAVCALLYLLGEASSKEIGKIANYTGAAVCKISGVGIITKDLILQNA